MSQKGFDALNAGIADAVGKAAEAMRHVPEALLTGRAELMDKSDLPVMMDVASNILIAYAIANTSNICEISEVDHDGVRFTFRITCECVDAKPANTSEED